MAIVLRFLVACISRHHKSQHIPPCPEPACGEFACGELVEPVEPVEGPQSPSCASCPSMLNPLSPSDPIPHLPISANQRKSVVKSHIPFATLPSFCSTRPQPRRSQIGATPVLIHRVCPSLLPPIPHSGFHGLRSLGKGGWILDSGFLPVCSLWPDVCSL
jgi:hypothetical protein